MRSIPFMAMLCAVSLAFGCGDESSADPNPSSRSTVLAISGVTNSYRTTRDAWKQLLDVAAEAGVSSIHLQPLGWGEAETSPGTFNFTDFDELFALKDKYALSYTLDIGTPVGISRHDLPADLEFVSFRDPEMIRRYRAYIAAHLNRFNNPTHVILHTETASNFLADDPEAFAAYCDLLASTADYVRSLAPKTKVGIYATADDSADALAKMGRNTDFFSFGYNADRGDLDHKATLKRLYGMAGNKRIGIHEIGIPTAARVGGSEAAQVAFVNLIFDLAAQHASQLEFISYYQAFDEDPAVTSVWLPAMFPDWSDTMQQDGLAWFGSLGLHRFDGTPKPAWATFKQRVKAFPR